MNTSRQPYLDGFLAGTGASVPANGSAVGPSAAPPESRPREQGAGGGVVQDEPVAAVPLSWEEQVKRTLFPLDAFPRLLANAGTDQPPSLSDRFRFQWFGLFYQSPEKDAFVVRLRLPGGRLQGFQLLGLAAITQELAGGSVEFNALGGLDLPGVPVRACAEVLRRLDGIGLSARGTGGDCVQAVRGGEQEDGAPGGSTLVYRLVGELEQVLAQSREFGDLPGPCEVVFRAADEWLPPGSDRVAGDEARIVFQAWPPPLSGTGGPEAWPGVQAPEAGTWQVQLPGDLRLGAALATAETLPLCLALLRVWSRQADRTDRKLAAFASFCARLGREGLQSALEAELGQNLPPPPCSAAFAGERRIPPHFQVPDGRLLSEQMVALARLATRYGIDALRFLRPGCLLLPDGTDAAEFKAALHG